MKIFLIFLLFISFIQGNDCLKQYDDWKKEYSKIKSFSFEFEEKTQYELLDKAEESKGKFFFKEPNLYKIESNSFEIIANKEFVYNYDPMNKQTTIQKRDKTSNPLEIIFLNKDLNSYYNIDSCQQIEKEIIFYFSKKEETPLPYSKIILNVRKDKKSITAFQVTDYNETNTFIKINKFKETDIKSDFFLYQKKMGVEEIEMF